MRYSAALAAACGGGLALAQANGARELPTLAPMIEAVSPAVVNIAVSTKVPGGPQTPQDELLRRFFDFEGPPGPQRDRELEGAGSGVIVDAANGYILTNHHVVANADKITVTLAREPQPHGARRGHGPGLGSRGSASRSRRT